MNLKLNEFLLALIDQKNFYGLLAASINRVARPGLGTMAVGMQAGRATLFYDPAFIDALPLVAAKFILEHEMLHLVLGHIPRYLEALSQCATEEERTRVRVLNNIAMDCAINDMLRTEKTFAPTQAWLKTRRSAQDSADPYEGGMVLPEAYALPLGRSFENYLWLLAARPTPPAAPNAQWLIIEGDGADASAGAAADASAGAAADASAGAAANTPPKDTHDLWVTSSEPTSTADTSPTAEDLLSQAQQLQHQIKNSIRTAVAAVGGRTAGNVPAGIAALLAAWLDDPIVPWWTVLNKYTTNARTSRMRRTVAQPNRALLALAEEDQRILPTPGRMRDKTWRIFLYVDTSGSMSDTSLQIVQNELRHLLRTDPFLEVRYMQGDCVTTFDQLLHSDDPVPETITGRGGTNFNAYFEYMQQYLEQLDTTPDFVMVYTDGEASPVAPQYRLPSEIPVVWLVTPGTHENFNQGYGTLLRCDPQHNKEYV